MTNSIFFLGKSSLVGLIMLACAWRVFGRNVDYSHELAEAFRVMESSTWRYVEVVGEGAHTTRIRKCQRGNADGTVFRVEEAEPVDGAKLDVEKLPSRRRVYRTIYNDEGRTLLLFTRFGVSGVQIRKSVPHRTIAAGDSVTGKSMQWNGRPAWLIRWTHHGDWVDELIIDQQSHFILSTKTYNEMGKLTMKSSVAELELAPTLPDSLFEIPRKTRLSFAKDEKEFDRKETEMLERFHSDFETSKEQNAEWRSWFWGIAGGNPWSFFIRWGRWLAVAIGVGALATAFYIKYHSRRNEG